MSLQDALKQYDRTADRAAVELSEKMRQEMVRRFPLDAWPNMPLERYALGQGNNQESFCWWAEFGTRQVASMMGGGGAKKHLIYRQRDGHWNFKATDAKTETEAWTAVRAGFVEAFAKAQGGQWDSIDDIPAIAHAHMLRAKTLYVYFPNDLLPICSSPHIRHFLNWVAGTTGEEMGSGTIRLNRLLLSKLRQIEEMKDWHTKELERFLYHWADPRDQRRIVKIAPGENAKYWKECLDNGYIRVGWGKVGDLEDFETKEAFRAKFRELYGSEYRNNESQLTRKSNEVWTLKELQPGDQIVANDGISKVLAVGTVAEHGYGWVEHESDYSHIVHVNWDTSYAQDIPPQKKWAFVTVADVPQALAGTILSKKPVVLPLPVDPIFREMASALERKGQVILYGPPGTGKTYTAQHFAVWWLMRKMGTESPELLSDAKAFAEAMHKLSTAQVVRRAWWVVANPREWSWDRLFKDNWVDYRYGRLQRNYPLVRKGDLVIGYQSTPDKKIVALARVSRELYTNAKDESSIDLEPLARVKDGPTYEELLADDILKASEPMRFRNQGTLFALSENEFDHLAAILGERNADLRSHLEMEQTVGPLTQLTFHASYSYEDFIEGFRPVDTGSGHLVLRLEDGVFKRICREAQANPNKPYLVMIDEINRANVAKVLGELITLLERDKRGMVVNLPQSKEAFTIPPNVYVLGTMNTADRSIKLLDAALRRRFAFLELMPDSSLLQGGKVGNLALDEFLDKLNARIAKQEGREKQIGHSYLLDGSDPVSEPEEFARRFRQEILPLLQEYCYEDYKVLADYIGEKLVKQDVQMLNEEILNDADSLIDALEEEFAQEDVVP